MEYRLRWVPGVGFLRWACTFHIFCADFICVGHPTQTRFLVEYGLNGTVLDNHDVHILSYHSCRNRLCVNIEGAYTLYLRRGVLVSGYGLTRISWDTLKSGDGEMYILTLVLTRALDVKFKLC